MKPVKRATSADPACQVSPPARTNASRDRFCHLAACAGAHPPEAGAELPSLQAVGGRLVPTTGLAENSVRQMAVCAVASGATPGFSSRGAHL